MFWPPANTVSVASNRHSYSFAGSRQRSIGMAVLLIGHVSPTLAICHLTGNAQRACPSEAGSSYLAHFMRNSTK